MIRETSGIVWWRAEVRSARLPGWMRVPPRPRLPPFGRARVARESTKQMAGVREGQPVHARPLQSRLGSADQVVAPDVSDDDRRSPRAWPRLDPSRREPRSHLKLRRTDSACRRFAITSHSSDGGPGSHSWRRWTPEDSLDERRFRSRRRVGRSRHLSASPKATHVSFRTRTR